MTAEHPDQREWKRRLFLRASGSQGTDPSVYSEKERRVRLGAVILLLLMGLMALGLGLTIWALATLGRIGRPWPW